RQDWLISAEEKAALEELLDWETDDDLKNKLQTYVLPKNPDAALRVKRAIETACMLMPYANRWYETPPLSVMATMYNEQVMNKFVDLNLPETPGDITRLNKIILT